MPSLGKYRKKIKSVKNIAKITKAMQLVAASKMKKAQSLAMSGKEYSDGITDLTHMLSKQLDKGIHPLIEDHAKSNARNLAILVAPEKGLCGGLIANLSRFVSRFAHDVSPNLDVIVVGSKARQVAKRLQLSIVAEFPLGLSYPSYDLVPPITRFIEERFISGEVASVKLIYAKFINTMVQDVTMEVLLPLDLTVEPEADVVTNKRYLFEPTPSDIVNSLLKMYLETKIYHILLEAYASEQSARMVAMKNATDNASSLIEQLTIEFNKVRQSAITSEILDIGSAAYAVA